MYTEVCAQTIRIERMRTSSGQVTNIRFRDIYYRDPELFVKQPVVDRYVDDIAYTLGVKRQALNVVRKPNISISIYFIDLDNLC
jgi:DNA topoisomerase VI subunit A